MFFTTELLSRRDSGFGLLWYLISVVSWLRLAENNTGLQPLWEPNLPSGNSQDDPLSLPTFRSFVTLLQIPRSP